MGDNYLPYMPNQCPLPRAEKATAERNSIEDAYVTEARLGADEDVEELGCVGEVGTHERVWHAEEVEEV
jgi:hypothetical protein